MAKSSMARSSSAASSKTSTLEPASVGDSTSNSFKDAANQYGMTLVQLSAALQEAQQEALQKYLDTLSSNLKPGRLDSVSAAYQDLIKAMNGQDPVKITTAHAAYMDTVKGLHSGLESATKTAAQDYTGALKSIWDTAQEDAVAAYASFIKNIEPALNDLPNLANDPKNLILLGQSLCIAGFFGAQTAAGVPTTSTTTSNRTESEQTGS